MAWYDPVFLFTCWVGFYCNTKERETAETAFIQPGSSDTGNFRECGRRRRYRMIPKDHGPLTEPISPELISPENVGNGTDPGDIFCSRTDPC